MAETADDQVHRHLLALVRRPDDLPAYPLFAGTEGVHRRAAELTDEEFEERVTGGERTRPRREWLAERDALVDPHNVNHYGNFKGMVPPFWEVYGRNVATRDIGLYITLTFWSSKAYGYMKRHEEVFRFMTSVNLKPRAPEGVSWPYWCYSRFWDEYWKTHRYRKRSRMAVKYQRSFFFLMLAYWPIMGLMEHLLQPLLKLDQRVFYGLPIIPLMIYRHRVLKRQFWDIRFLFYLCLPIVIFWQFSSLWRGIPNRLGWRFRGDYVGLDLLEETPDFYRGRDGEAKSGFNDVHHLRDKYMGYTKQF